LSESSKRCTQATMHEPRLQLQVTLLNRTSWASAQYDWNSTASPVLLLFHISKETTHACMHVWPAIDWLISTGRAACMLVSCSVHVLIGGRQPAGRPEHAVETKWTNEWTVAVRRPHQIICTPVTEGVSIMRACQPPAAVTLWLGRPEGMGGTGCSYIHEHAAAAACMHACYGLVHFPSQPKIFSLPPITSNLSTHAWNIKCK
jgi:hypothetical protein